MEGATKYCLKILLGLEIFRSMDSWATKFFLKMCKTLRSPAPTYLMYGALKHLLLDKHYTNFIDKHSEKIKCVKNWPTF